MNGTPAQRSFHTRSTQEAKVTARLPAGTEGSSAYAGKVPSALASYCPSTTSRGYTTGCTQRSSFCFSSRTSSGASDTGRSMAISAMTCSKWFWMMSRTMPCESK